MPALRPCVAAILACGLGTFVAGDPAVATDRPGRYAMQPIEGGVLRLDTETGQMALCTRKDAAVVCEPTSTPASVEQDAERLAEENRQLKAEIRRLEDLLAEAPRRPATRQPRLELPSEADVDKALSYMERMLKKFRDKMRDLDSDRGRGT